ncbi:ComF family protein [Paucilactobacillus wasatchensis]|uniref:Protein YhgH required for utilization of DNA as sole source of carbon and energy n=1 Tax=Paucilactobacillus wasatchensis TaxID=1335616 RepID=A0A0D1A4W8_9LACO|nr:phosphoribosyltransferase family protein [Paucilactobacillus wasatchensis]KIS02930.1 protein YhgH required for utilization of DNA as sole source of carbon and energy [Paucilactobacillus wasatchensis]
MQCLMCNAVTDGQLTLTQILSFSPIIEPQICKQCSERFEYINAPVCQGCGKPQQDGQLCVDCQAWQAKNSYLIHNRSLIVYNDATKQFMKQYKFSGDFQLRHIFAIELQNLIDDCQADLVLPIPISQYTWQTRGFNQVSGLLLGKTESLIQPINQGKHSLQSHKKREQRLATQQPFKLIAKAAEQIKNQKVVLVDDVYTTGRTLYHAADLVLSCHPSQLQSITLAR